MSEEKTEQAVVDSADTQPKAGNEAPDAREKDELDTLLEQYKTAEPKPSQTQPETKTETASDPDAKRRLDALEREFREQQFQREIGPVIENIKGGIPPGVLTDTEILDLLESRAKRDERLQAAWLNRTKNPQGWKKVQDGLARDFAKRFDGLPDKNATDDREAVAASVRGASTKAPEGKAPDFSRMNNAEFNQEKEKLFND